MKFKILLLGFMLTVVAAYYAHAAPPAAAPVRPAGAAPAAIVQTPWSVRCDKESDAQKGDKKAAAAPPHCEAFQRLSVAKTGQRAAEFAVGYTGSDKSAVRGVLILPLGILLTDDLQMQVDNGQIFKFKVRYCTGDGCYAFLDFNQAVLDMLKAANTISIDARAFSGQDVVIKLQMSGFAPAFQKL